MQKNGKYVIVEDQLAAKDYYRKTWIFLHGISSMLATKSIQLSGAEMKKCIREYKSGKQKYPSLIVQVEKQEYYLLKEVIPAFFLLP